MRRAVNQLLPFQRRTFYIESAGLWKQLKWNKFPFYGDKVSGKIVRGG